MEFGGKERVIERLGGLRDRRGKARATVREERPGNWRIAGISQSKGRD